MAADVAQSLAQLVHRGSHGTARRGQRGLPGAARRDRRQDPAEDTRDAIGDGHGQHQELLAEERVGQRTEDGEADHEGGLQGQDEEAVGGHELAALDDHGDHGRLRGREEGGQGGHDGDDHVDEHQLVGEEDEQQEEHGAGHVRGDEDPAPVEHVHEDAGDGPEDDGRDQEREQQDAHRGARVGEVVDGHGQAEEGHVAADLAQDLGAEEGQELGIAEHPPGLVEVGPALHGDGVVDLLDDRAHRPSPT